MLLKVGIIRSTFKRKSSLRAQHRNFFVKHEGGDKAEIIYFKILLNLDSNLVFIGFALFFTLFPKLLDSRP
jgi:hypothetical protein